MASRNRPRAGQLKDDADEERSIWNQLRNDARRVDVLLMKSDEVGKRIQELDSMIKEKEERGEKVPPDLDNELEELLRQNIRLTEEIQTLVEGEGDSHPTTILTSLSILAGLRQSTENEPLARAASQGKSQRNLKRKHELSAGLADDRDSLAADSPGGPSPKVAGSTASRLMGKAGSRAGSVPAGREASVKTEDGDDGSERTAPSSDRHRLRLGTEVCYRNKTKSVEGEGILCRVTSVIGEGKQRRYEILDADPEPPIPQHPYRASVTHLIAIPDTNAKLPELPPRKPVLALYPNTTTFYRAEVVCGRAGDIVRKPGSALIGFDPNAAAIGPSGELKQGMVLLKFEGEEEADRELAVERRYVLIEDHKARS